MSASAGLKVHKKVRVLGIDPGSRLLGYGVVDVEGRSVRVVAYGTLKVKTGEEENFGDRLLNIYSLLTEIIVTHRPTEAAFENVFFAKNAVSALKLGQARGAAILTAQIQGLSFFEYSSTAVKQTVTGYGRADKDQVAQMVTRITGYSDFDTPDASDGLAIAICHAMHRTHLNLSQTSVAGDRALKTEKKTSKKLSLADAVKHARKFKEK